MKIYLLIGAVLPSLYILVKARSLNKVHEKDVNILSYEDRDGASRTKFGSQMSFIEEFLALVSHTEDGDKKEINQQKVLGKESTTEEEKIEVNERYDKIFWTDDELYQLKISENNLSKESPSKQFENSKASENPGGDGESREVNRAGGEDEAREGFRQVVPLTPASDRQLLVEVSEFSRELVEEKYTELIQSLPARIEEAEGAIRKTIATQRMLGYTFVVAFVLAAILDSLALVMMEPKSLTQALTLILTDKSFYGFLHWIWWYAFGFSGPWMFPNTNFPGGDNLLDLPGSSSAQYFALLADYDLSLNIQSFTEKSPAESLILMGRLRRDFNTRLGLIVSKKEKNREAFLVHQTFTEMLTLVTYHAELSSGPPATQHDIQLLDAELDVVWTEIRDLVEETHSEVSARRAETAALYIFVALLNISGMLGGITWASGRVQNILEKEDLEEKEDPYDKLVDVVNWVVMDDHPSLYVKQLGGTALTLSFLGWGYSYTATYLLFLEHYEPGCGTLELDDVSAKYFQLSSVKAALLGRGGSVVRLRWDLENWRRDLRLGLHCLLVTSEGARLEETIELFLQLASARLDLTDTAGGGGV